MTTQRIWIDDPERKQRRIDFAICKRIFVESWPSSHISGERRRLFVDKIEPHVRSVLRFWLRPAARFICLLIWEFYSLNFGNKDWIKRAMKDMGQDNYSEIPNSSAQAQRR